MRLLESCHIQTRRAFQVLADKVPPPLDTAFLAAVGGIAMIVTQALKPLLIDDAGGLEITLIMCTL